MRTTDRKHSRGPACLGIALALASGLVVGAALQSGGNERQSANGALSMSRAEALEYTFDHLVARSESSVDVMRPRSVVDYLPNQLVSFNGSAPAPLVTDFIQGRVTSVSNGAGYFTEGDAPRATVVPFDDTRAMWKVLELTVAVEESFAGEFADRARIGLVIDAEIDASIVEAGLRGTSVVVPLVDDNYFTHDSELLSIAQGGDGLGLVDQSGITFPVLEEEDPNFVGAADTVIELQAEATERRPILDVTFETGLVLPENQ